MMIFRRHIEGRTPPQMHSEEPPLPPEQRSPADRYRDAQIILKAFGLGDFFDDPAPPRIPQGSVEVIEGPVYLDTGGSSGSKGGPQPNSPRSPKTPPADPKTPSPGRTADDIGDWDGPDPNPYKFDSGTPATPPAPNTPEGPDKKIGGIFKVIDDLLNFAQQ